MTENRARRRERERALAQMSHRIIEYWTLDAARENWEVSYQPSNDVESIEFGTCEGTTPACGLPVQSNSETLPMMCHDSRGQAIAAWVVLAVAGLAGM